MEKDLSLDLLFSYNIFKRENFITCINDHWHELKDDIHRQNLKEQVFDTILKRLEKEDIN
jgi:hypothetical protein